jgi:hypothetical protein
MPFIALERLVVGIEPVLNADGEPTLDRYDRPVTQEIVRNVGDIVPEAEGWRDAGAYVSSGKIAHVPADMIAMRAELDQVKAELAEMKQNAHTHNKPKGG